MSAELECEIQRINKAHMPASWRSEMVRKAKAIAACVAAGVHDGLFERRRESETAWCRRCGNQHEKHYEHAKEKSE